MASAKKKTAVLTEETQLQLLYSEDAHLKYWESHLFNEVYLRRDLPEKHTDRWNSTDSVGFQHFVNTLRNLATEYADNEKELSNWSETETINNWVKHILDGLGWNNNCNGVQNPFLEETSFRYDAKTCRTDILIVDHPKEKQYINQVKGDDKLVEARTSVIMPVEVKYWQRLEEYRQGRSEEKKRSDGETDDISKIASPNEQIIQYMDILKKNWGVLTDGARWRLFNSELSSEDANRYYEFNLYSLVKSILTEQTEADRAESIESAKYFYFFFSKESFFPATEGEEAFVDEILRYSKKYVGRVEEDLKERFVKAMNIACNGLSKSLGGKPNKEDLSLIRNVAESTLFNVLFIKSLESRGILPMNSADYKKISLSNTIDKIERFDPDKEPILNSRELERAFKKGNGNSFSYAEKGTELHDRIVRLTMVIHDGSSKDKFGFEISGFKESIFSEKEWSVFKNQKLTNSDWVKILFQLGYAESESLNRKYQQIPYSYFTPRQLGSIYESFLEFQIQKADSDMVFEKKQWKKVDLNSRKYKGTNLPMVKSGDLFFTPDNLERKSSGSYYTPDYIVQAVTRETLLPKVHKKSAKEILKVRVCDPSMGSGHFLVAALNFLTKEYLDAYTKESDSDISALDAKRLVLDSCIYGMDINPRAVKLAKLSLWLETARINQKLERLSDQLVNTDSLLPEWSSLFKKDGKAIKIDCVVGNPPYLDIQTLNSISKSYVDRLRKEFVCASEGMFDIYQLFVEKTFNETNSRVGLILPNKFFTVDYGKNLREFLIEKSAISKIVDFKHHHVFPGVSAYTCLLFLDHSSKSGFDYISANSRELVDLEEPVYFDLKGIPKDLPWSFGSASLKETMGQMDEAGVPISKLGIQISRGSSSGDDKVYFLKKDGKSYEDKEGNSVSIESKILRKVLKAKNFGRYEFTEENERFIIYPYASDGKLIPEADIKRQYPLAYKYLTENKPKLLKRKGVRNWYAFSAPRCLELHDRAVILSPMTADKGRWTLAPKMNEYCMMASAGFTIEFSEQKFSKYYLLGILNSSLMFSYLEEISDKIGGGWSVCTKQYLNRLPVVLPDAKNKALVSEIEAKVKLALKENNKKKREALAQQIDLLVEKVYGIKKSQKRVA